MSLFDDDTGSSSSSLDSCEATEVKSNISPSAAFINSKLLPNNSATRFTLTENEAKRAEQRWRTEVGTQSLLNSSVKSSQANNNNNKQQQESRFHASMAEALRLRKDAREAILLQRIQKQREIEANSLEFVEKDLQVGVFVTPQYLAALKRHTKTKESLMELNSQNNAEGNEDSTHNNSTLLDDDPLENYVRQLEEKRAAVAMASSSVSSPIVSLDSSSLSGNYYDTQMMMHVAEEGLKVNNENNIPQKENSSSYSNFDSLPISNPNGVHSVVLSSSSIVSTSVSTSIQNNIISNNGEKDTNMKNNDKVITEVLSIRPEDVLREARESRKRRRADRHVIEAAARRFHTRAMERLEV